MMRVKRGLMSVGLVAAFGLPILTSGGVAAAQTGCNPAYYPDQSGNCVPNSAYDLDCADINWGIFQLANVYNDPYGLDVYNGPGNGWTCDGVG